MLAEEAVRDRLSFRRFCGIPLDAETPEHSSIWRFRQTVEKLGLSEKLLPEVNRQPANVVFSVIQTGEFVWSHRNVFLAGHNPGKAKIAESAKG